MIEMEIETMWISMDCSVGWSVGLPMWYMCIKTKMNIFWTNMILLRYRTAIYSYDSASKFNFSFLIFHHQLNRNSSCEVCSVTAAKFGCICFLLFCFAFFFFICVILFIFHRKQQQTIQKVFVYTMRTNDRTNERLVFRFALNEEVENCNNQATCLR